MDVVQPELLMSDEAYSGPGQRVVLAVVGAGHLRGIEDRWHQVRGWNG